jgi:hypothetical protein
MHSRNAPKDVIKVNYILLRKSSEMVRVFKITTEGLGAAADAIIKRE